MISSSLRQLVRARAKGCCEYCLSQEDYSPERFSIEHIYPCSKGGSSDLDNLALSCQGCNNCKYTKTHALDPVTKELVRLYHPRQDRWNAHFTWNEDYSTLVGLTSVGRATIDALKLNRLGLVNLRQALYQVKIHPPKEYPAE